MKTLPTARPLQPLEAIEAGAPLVVNVGMGVDSLAVLVGLHERGIRPDLCIFSDVGAEKDATYAVIPPLRAWLRSVGFPDLVVVRRAPPTAPYSTLLGNCLANDSLPSIATRGGDRGSASCSVEWKKRVIDRYVERWAPAIAAWNKGLPIVRAIGFDASAADCKRAAKVSKSDAAAATSETPILYWYPLQEGVSEVAQWYPLQQWGWSRSECKEAIDGSRLGDYIEDSTGRRLPPKSSCVMCSAMKKAEVLGLARTEPHNALLCLVLEERAKTGKNRFRRAGLGINWSWAGWLEEQQAQGVEGIEWVATWRDQARELGLLDATWEAYSEEVVPLRLELEAARAAVKEAGDSATTEQREREQRAKKILAPIFAPDRPRRELGYIVGGWAHLEPKGSQLPFRKVGPSLEAFEGEGMAEQRVTEAEAKAARAQRRSRSR